MADIVEQSTYVAGVRRIDQEDLVLGGEDTAIDNEPHRALAWRTKHIKDRLDNKMFRAKVFAQTETPGSAGLQLALGFQVPTVDDYTVTATPVEDPRGGLGEVWFVKTTTTFTLYNSGDAGIKMDVVVLVREILYP